MYVNCGECGRRYYCQTDPAECDSLSGPVFTNADKIRSMSDEELDCFLHKVTYGMDECPYEYGSEKALEWLQQPAEEADNETD